MRGRASGVVAVGALWAAAAAGPAAAAGWMIDPTPLVGSQGNQLFAVSCPLQRSCTAVGSFFDAGGNQLTLVQHWNGTAWTVQPTPNPPDSRSSQLVTVSCASPSECTAVGSYTSPATGSTLALVERWNGSTWSIQPTPVPKDAGPTTLSGVSCVTARQCIAVGNYFDNDLAAGVTLAERWNGSAWSVLSTPNPAGGTFGALRSVSCVSDRQCVAVGNYQTGATPIAAALAEGWNGSTWSIRVTPNPVNARTVNLSGVSCTAAGSACMAVGSYQPNDGNARTLSEGWNGTSWSVRSTPVPAGSSTSQLNSISCESPTLCTAVGAATTGLDDGPTLAEGWDGAHWSIQSTANPPGPHVNSLGGVSCYQLMTCTAAGSSNDSTFTPATLAERSPAKGLRRDTGSAFARRSAQRVRHLSHRRAYVTGAGLP
jgi:hypothetical protein